MDCHGTASPVVAGTSIQASAATPIALDFSSQPIFASLVFSSSDNGYDALGIRGGTLASSAELIQRGATVGANPGTTWRLTGAGDYLGSGQSDLLWQNNSTGAPAIWLLNGTTFQSGLDPGQNPGTSWKIIE